MKLLLWMLYWPLLKFVSFFIFWFPEFQERKKFEKKNETDVLCESFKSQGQVADLCFEFSSDGEYQQVASLIDDALTAGKRLELVFFSPSVEKTITQLAKAHHSQIRYLRYPLIQFSPWGKGRAFNRWITSKQLIMVRYDLFPEFLAWARVSGNKLSLLWVTFKKERVKNKKISWLKRSFLKAAQKIIYASKPDQDFGLAHSLSGRFYDFRMEQIKRRLEVRAQKFQQHFPVYTDLKKSMELFPRNKRLIIGNAWPSDLFLFKELPEDFFVAVVPHELTPEILEAFKKALIVLGRDVVMLNDGTHFNGEDTFVINKKGVLCELYADFGLAYVGGGFEVGVHSILEPLVAGSDAIACGELHHRSTEFDVAQTMGRVTEVKSSKATLEWMTKQSQTHAGESTLAEVFAKYVEFREDVISC